jgi:transcriptional regulator with XRE-family HTH domain
MPRRPTSAILPRGIKTSLIKLGRDIRTARLRRRLTAAMMAERLGTSRPTYLNVERGHPGVSVGAYAMALYALGLGTPLGDLADASRDDQGLLLEAEQLPKRVRPKKTPRAL